MSDTVCLMKGTDHPYFSSFFIERSNKKHSGNWFSIKSVLEKGIIEGHSFGPGFYGERLKDRIILGPIDVLMRWKDDC